VTTCEEIQGRAAGLVALPADDPERRSAFEHARTCPACARALGEAERVMALLDALPPPPPPSAQALRRASAEILGELGGGPDAARPVPAQPRLAPAAAALAAFGLIVLLARHRLTDRASLLQAGLLLALALLRVAGLTTRGWLGVGVTVMLSGLFALLGGAGGLLLPAVGWHCLLTESIAAALPLATTALLLARRHTRGGAALYAGVAAAGALAGQAGLHLSCPAQAALPHLIAFHVGGVLLAALVGAASARVLALRGAR